ncbi:MAG: putative drug exporter of the superfamily [Actinomycetota bacterium]|nr:putative drug exporter of the superfamily [Actinomycetota bacterium]
MAAFLYRVGGFSRRHHWLVIVSWLLLLALVTAAAAAFREPMTSQFRIPGAGFQTVMDTLKAEIPSASGDTGTILVTSPSAPFTTRQKAAVSAAVTTWQKVEGVAEIGDPFVLQGQLDVAAGQLAAGRAQAEAGKAQLAAGRSKLDAAAALGLHGPALDAQKAELAKAEATLAAGERELTVNERRAALVKGIRLVSSDGRAALVQLRFDGLAQSLSSDEREEILRVGSELERSGVTVDVDSTIVGDIDSIIGPKESVGVLIAALVLFILLGTLVAVGLPLATALLGVAAGVGGTIALSGVVEMNSVTPALGLMIGLAVGIDYSLFIINRHRTQLLTGLPAEESIPRANGTSGNAVVFAGLTVVIALAALGVTGIPFLGVMGRSAAATVAIAVLVAVTLTPALLSLAGHRVIRARTWEANGFTATGVPIEDASHFVDPDETGAGPVRLRHGWGELVTTHPWAATLLGLVVLGVCAIPAGDLRLGLPDGSSEPAGSTAYRAYTLTAKYFGAGENGPLVAVATLPPGLDGTTAVEKSLDVAEKLARVEGVVKVVPIGVSKDNDVAAFQIVPEDGPSEQATVDLVSALRDTVAGVRAATGAEVGLTGQTVANIDVSEKLSDAMVSYLAIVVGLSLVILVMVFRSLIVPLVATGGFLLSVAAAFGGVVAVYQWGWLGGFFGVENPSAVLSFLPTLLIGVLFGLAMDYQMFLVSGMREAYVHGQDARKAVLTGFHHGRHVVTAAALIMISVFAGFVFAELTMIRPIGFALAFGVLVDAFVVRMTLTPAVMHLLGDRAWWLPGWLDRIVPDVDVEGAKLVSRQEFAGPGERQERPTPAA